MDFDIDWGVAPIAIAIWAVLSACIVFLPDTLGIKGYSFMYKIMIPLILLPISYVITKSISER